jgi:hypothetical protein
VPVSTIEQEFFSARTRQSFGIREGYDIYQLLNCLSHYLKTSGGMVYPLQYKQPQHGPASTSLMARYQESDNSLQRTQTLLPFECKNSSGVCNQQSGALEEDIELDGEVNGNSDAHFEVAVCDRIGVSEVMQNAKGNVIEGMLNLIFYCLM